MLWLFAGAQASEAAPPASITHAAAGTEQAQNRTFEVKQAFSNPPCLLSA